jgi:hypothetical protein
VKLAVLEKGAELASDLIQGLQYGFKLQWLPIEFKSRGLVGEMALIAQK